MSQMADKIKKNREFRHKVAEHIHEFQYRQALVLSQFEKKTARKPIQQREEIVHGFEIYSDPMADYRYYTINSDRCRMIEHLSGEWPLHPSLWRRVRDKIADCLGETGKLPVEKAEAVMMSYHLSLPAEREKFKKNLVAGVVEDRLHIGQQRPNRQYARCTTTQLGKSILIDYQPALSTPESCLNLLHQLSYRSDEDKKRIYHLFKEAVVVSKEQNIDTGVNLLSNALIPYFFKESRPLIVQSEAHRDEIAQYTALSARKEKFKRIQELTKIFAWLFLTEPPFTQQQQIKQLFSDHPRRDRRKVIRNFFRLANEGHCRCGD